MTKYLVGAVMAMLLCVNIAEAQSENATSSPVVAAERQIQVLQKELHERIKALREEYAGKIEILRKDAKARVEAMRKDAAAEKASKKAALDKLQTERKEVQQKIKEIRTATTTKKR